MTVDVRVTPVADESTIDGSTVDESTIQDAVRDLPPVEETAAETAAVAQGEPVEGDRTHRRTGLVRRAWFWLTLLAVVLLAVSVVSSLGWRRADNRADGLQRTTDLSTSALQAARKYTVDLTTYSYKQLAKQQTTLNAESTAKFRKTFADSSKTLDAVFTQLHAVATGTVVDAAVKAVSGTSAVVLVFVDQKASSTQLKKAQTQSSRLRMTLVRQQGKWLLDSVDLV